MAIKDVGRARRAMPPYDARLRANALPLKFSCPSCSGRTTAIVGVVRAASTVRCARCSHPIDVRSKSIRAAIEAIEFAFGEQRIP